MSLLYVGLKLFRVRAITRTIPAMPSLASFRCSVTATSVLLAIPAAAQDPVDLFFEAGGCLQVGTTFRIDLFAASSGSSTSAVAAIDVILHWNDNQLELIDSDNTFAGHPWLITGFLPDPDGINTSTVDGDALFTALTSPSLPATIPPGAGLLVTSFLFRPLVPIPNGSVVSMTAQLGAFGETAVYSYRTPGLSITGDISGTAVAFTCPLGTRYCSSAVPNSTGVPGSIEATGSLVVASNDLQLEASNLPLGAFGYFLTSRTQDFRPFPGGSQGILCLGDPIGRAVGSVIFNTGMTGLGTATTDLTMMPQPSGPVQVLPGDTWNFQAWHRDANPTVTSNFTDAISITFY